MVAEALSSKVKYNLRTVRSRIGTNWKDECDEAEARGEPKPRNPLQHEKERTTIDHYYERKPESDVELESFSEDDEPEPDTQPATQQTT